MSLLKKKEEKRLDEQSAAEYYEMGGRFVQKIKLDVAVKKINEFGQRNPLRFFSIILMLIICSFGLNLYRYFNRDLIYEEVVDIRIDSSIQAKEQEVKANITQELQSIYAETEYLVDTLSIVMAKEHLTKEDSLFVMKKMARLEALDKVLNEQYIRKDDRKD